MSERTPFLRMHQTVRGGIVQHSAVLSRLVSNEKEVLRANCEVLSRNPAHRANSGKRC